MGNETSTISAPNELSRFTAAPIAVLTCGSTPSIMYSFGTPNRMPRNSFPRLAT